MNGRNVVITGAGRGLGLGLAHQFAQRGDTVIGTVRSPSTAGDLAAIARVEPLDLTEDRSIEALAEALADLDRIDVLINNAGINATAVGAPDDGRGIRLLERAHFLAEIDVNAAGPMLLTRALIPRLAGSGRAKIVNISSQLGSMTFAAGAGVDVGYNASKAALNMVTVRTAAELAADGVTTVALHPGWVRTDMGGTAAALTVEESASAIACTIDDIGPADNGRFLRWDGTHHPW